MEDFFIYISFGLICVCVCVLQGGDLFDDIVLFIKYMERDVSSMINNLLYVFKYFYNLCIVYWDVKFENLLVSLKYCYKVSLV